MFVNIISPEEQCRRKKRKADAAQTSCHAKVLQRKHDVPTVVAARVAPETLPDYQH
jgi:hypothetical protein